MRLRYREGVITGSGMNFQTRISCSEMISKLYYKRRVLVVMEAYPMETDIGNVVSGHDPRVIVRGDTPSLAHAGCVCVANVTTINVRNKVKRADAIIAC